MAVLAVHPGDGFHGYGAPVNAPDQGRGPLACTLATVGRVREALALVREVAAAAFARVGEATLGFPPRLPRVAALILQGQWAEALAFLPLARRLRHSLQSWAFPAVWDDAAGAGGAGAGLGAGGRDVPGGGGDGAGGAADSVRARVATDGGGARAG